MGIEVRDGIVYAPGARLIDRTGRRVLPIGRDGFEPAAESFVLVDKTMLIADVLDSGYAATLFCRPRRFGKTLNMTMLRPFSRTPRTAAPAQPSSRGPRSGRRATVATASTKAPTRWCT